MALKTNLKDLKPAKQRFSLVIDLISGGYFDREKFPDGKITVFPWDGEVDDWLVKRARQANKSRMPWELAAKLCDTNGCPIEKFPLGDINTITLVAKSIVFDSQIKYVPVCTSCGQENEQCTIRVPDELEPVGKKGPDYAGFDVVVLSHSGDEVKYRPLTVADEIEIESRESGKKTAVNDRLARIFSSIVSVGGGQPDSVAEILSWWNALHPADQDQFSREMNNNYPHLSTDINHICDVCGAKFVHALDVDSTFFRRSR